MSQNRKDFQSKPRTGGQKFGDKKNGAKGKAPRPDRGFSQRSEGDRPRSADRPDRKDARPRREEGSFGERPRGPRRDNNATGGRPPRREGSSFGDRPRRDSEGPRSGEERAPRSDRPRAAPRRDSNFSERPRAPRREGSSFGDRPRRDFDGQRNDRDQTGEKPFYKKPRFDDKDGSKEGRFEGKRPFGDKKSFGDKKFGDKKFGDKKSFGDKKFGDRPSRDRDDRRPQKSYQRYEERPKNFEKRVDVQDGARGPASFETQQKLKSQRQNYGAPSSAFLYGVHAVTEALLNPKRLHQRLLCTSRGFESMKAVLQQAVENGIKVPEVITVEKEDIERLLPREAVHQDILLDCQPLEEIFLGDILISAPENATILVLDQVTDPHNVGAILRSAASFGAVAVVAQRLHSPDITGMIAKAASGGVEHVPFVREVNLSRALEQLKDAGFFCIGLDEDGKKTLSELKMTGTKVAIVLGAEGDGLRRLVAENCDELVRLPTQGRIASLNVSNAAAVALYEMARK